MPTVLSLADSAAATLAETNVAEEKALTAKWVIDNISPLQDDQPKTCGAHAVRAKAKAEQLELDGSNLMWDAKHFKYQFALLQ